ncbi:MAG: NAD+ synthase [Gaiellales bacterium]|nr:NAD+ synthase [Gaiellales bacterium]
MKLALAQINPTVGDLEGNSALVARVIEEAQRAGADLVAFPELAISGYPPEDLLLKSHFVRDCAHALAEAATACTSTVAVIGCPLEEDGLVYNVAAVVARGRVQAVYRKILLPNYAVFDEKRYFVPGDEVLILDLPGGCVAVNVCEDIWYAGGPSEAAVAGHAAAIVNISMSPYHVGKGHEREQMLAERVRETGVPFAYVNGVGGQDELVFDGHSLVTTHQGEVLCRAPQFQEALVLVDLGLSRQGAELPQAETARHAADAGDQRTQDDGDRGRWPVRVVRIDPGCNVPNCMGAAFRTELRASCAGVGDSLPLEAEVYGALCLGVRDYVEKNRFRRVVMGMSGGIDSAFVACVAADALGPERVVAVSMPSRYTSEGTRSDARTVSEALGVEFREIPIEEVFAAYLNSLAGGFAGREPDVTEENIQARIRGNLLMALSNKFGWLVLTSGNKSEMAVGYATLYGDMAGGFAVIKDVPKTLVYRLARYRNTLGSGSGPLPESILTRPPSAELRPDQVDQDSLPPYHVLDRIVEAYVVLDESVEEVVAKGLARDEVERVARMIDLNEYKRRQAAPGVRITPKAFGKDRRLPITNRYHH